MLYELQKLSNALEALGLGQESDKLSYLLNTIYGGRYIDNIHQDLSDQYPNTGVSFSSYEGEDLLQKLSVILEDINEESDVQIFAETISESLDKNMLIVLANELKPYLG